MPSNPGGWLGDQKIHFVFDMRQKDVKLITQLVGVSYPGYPFIYNAIYRGVITPFITRGPSCTIPKINIAPENTPYQTERIVFQPPIFRDRPLVPRRVDVGLVQSYLLRTCSRISTLNWPWTDIFRMISHLAQFCLINASKWMCLKKSSGNKHSVRFPQWSTDLRFIILQGMVVIAESGPFFIFAVSSFKFQSPTTLSFPKRTWKGHIWHLSNHPYVFK